MFNSDACNKGKVRSILLIDLGGKKTLKRPQEIT